MNPAHLLHVYEAAKRDEHFFVEQHQRRLAYFTSLIIAVIGGIVLGTVHAKGVTAHLLLLLLPLLLVVIAEYAKQATGMIYRRFLETITVIAKLEQDLDMASIRTGTRWFEFEPIVHMRHLQSRAQSGTSEEFVVKHMEEGYREVVMGMLTKARYAGWFAFALVALKALYVVLLTCGIDLSQNWCCLWG